MAAASSGSVALGHVAIVGGGCYGTFYAGQLLRARERGKVSYRQVTVVDRDPRCQFTREIGSGAGIELAVEDWSRFFDAWLDRSAATLVVGPPDTIVPSPLMPHLMFEWLLRRARSRWPGRMVEQRSIPIGPGTPYDSVAPDGTRYVSFADWLCPVHCIEPAVCPMIRAPRSWEMSDALERLTTRLSDMQPTAGPVLFACRHRVYGVGMFDVSTVLGGDELVARAGVEHGSVDVVVGTISSCHGAASLLHVGG
jgi:hypothetical protein